MVPTGAKLISDLDILRCANLLIRQYGDAADFYACSRADELFERGDREGQRVWYRILAAIDALQEAVPFQRMQ